jgi:5-formaminoimidazole-4-carboxamide-1-(beta)-D-ribofuranosyl 5'-monophosphate synthetase
MISKKDVEEVTGKYDKNKIVVCTVGSHSALQILRGAKDEGFKTLLICLKKNAEFYGQWNLVDEFITVDSYKDILSEKVQEELRNKNAVLIPHGSFVEYVGAQNILDSLCVPLFGNRHVLLWESDRQKQFAWFRKAGLRIPKEYKSGKDIDALVMVKFPGAKGGRGYFLAKNAKEYSKKMKAAKVPESAKKESVIQEYVIGTRFYPHFFYSPIENKLELLGMDIRYESNIDGLARIPAVEQIGIELEPSYVVMGNIPVVMRESLLPALMKQANELVATSKKLFMPGMAGPFCLEMVAKEDMEFIYFEVSARIVAGTNLFVNGSAYSQLLYDEPMSTGRRICREIRNAVKNNKLNDVLY